MVTTLKLLSKDRKNSAISGVDLDFLPTVADSNSDILRHLRS